MKTLALIICGTMISISTFALEKEKFGGLPTYEYSVRGFDDNYKVNPNFDVKLELENCTVAIQKQKKLVQSLGYVIVQESECAVYDWGDVSENKRYISSKITFIK
jgi:hypothetical protein